MTELKTLKDLEYEIEKVDDNKDYIWALNDLKAEAVKWVKEFKREKNEIVKKYGDNPDTTPEFNSKIEAFKNFFNLTEKDLEEKE